MTKDEAVKLYKSKFWETMTYDQRTEFQLFEKKLCMPFDVFHEAVEKSLKRPVYTHEFGLNLKGLQKEFLGERSAPSLEDIINLIPRKKLLVVGIKN